MKKEHLILFIMIVLCIVTMPFATYAQQTQTTNKTRLVQDKGQEIKIQEEKPVTDCGYERSIKVAGFVSNPPFAWAEWDGDGENANLVTHGYSMNVFANIAKKLGLSYRSVGFSSYEDAIGALKRGEIDLLLTAYLPEGMGFGVTPLYPAYFKNVFTVYFSADRQYSFKTLDDLVKLKGIVRLEENIYKLFMNKKTLSNLDLERIKTSKAAFEALLDGTADYLIGSPYSTEAELRRYKLQKKIISSRIPLLEASLFFVLSSNTSCVKLKKLLSDEIQKYSQSGVGANEVRHEVDLWGDRFRYDPGLLPEEKPEEDSKDWMDPDW